MKGMEFRVKGFFRWFKSNTKMKRWLLLILIGIALCCYGMAEVLTSRQMEFIDLAKIAAIFVVGFICIIYSVIAIQKRTLEILVEDTDKRMKDEKSNIKSLIFNKRVYNQGPKVVAIGGGSGLNSVLRGLKNIKNTKLMIAINDEYADGRDVSWLWDADFEVLKNFNNKIYVSGTRADDMALRLKYAGVNLGLLVIDNNIKKTFDFALKSMEEDEKLIVLPTYTALLKLNKIIKDKTR